MTDRGRLSATVAAVAVGVVAIAFVAGMTGALPFAAGQSDGEALVEDVRERYGNAETYTADMAVTAANGSATDTSNLSLAAATPNSSRLTVADEAGDTVFGTNGTVAWVHDVANDTVRVYPLSENGSATGATAPTAPGVAPWNGTDDRGASHNWSNGHDYAASHPTNVSRFLEENVTATVVGEETVRGTETTVVRLDPTNESREGTSTLWVDDQRRLLRVRTTVGENVTTADLKDQQFNVSIHESTFRPPTDATVTVAVNERYDTFDDAQAGTTLDLRRLDAEGYAFLEAAAVTRGGVTVTTQQYARESGDDGNGDAEAADANSTVALFATADSLPGRVERDAENGTTVTVDGANATYVERESGGVVYWTDDGVTRGVAADLPREDLIDLASGVRS
jgi:outer membrane lipoprotein-sorting protein